MSKIHSQRKSCKDVFNAFLVIMARFAGLFEYFTNEDCHMHWPIAMVALHGIIFTIVFRKKKVALVVSLIADSVIMVILSLLGDCKVDYVVAGAGFAIMAVITAVSLATAEPHTSKNDDFIETLY